MATRWAVASGTWSTGSTWDGGTLPQSSDTVYADGKVVTIDQNVTVVELNNGARSGGTAGGYFQCNIAANITANVTSVAAVSCLRFGHSSGVINYSGVVVASTTSTAGYGLTITSTAEVNVSGTINGSTVNACVGILFTGTLLNINNAILNGYAGLTINCNSAVGVVNIDNATFNHYGNWVVQNSLAGTLNCTNITQGVGNYMINNVSTGIINYYGDLYNRAGVLFQNTSTGGTINIIGNLWGALAPDTTYTGRIVYNAAGGTINVTGNLTTRDVTLASYALIHNDGVGTINVTGNVTAGSVTSCQCISNDVAGYVNVTGNVIGGSHATDGAAIYGSGAGYIDITGNVTTGTLYPAIECLSIGAVLTLRGDMICNNYLLPFKAYSVKISPSAEQAFRFQDTAGANRVMSTVDAIAGQPTESDIRYGVLYGLTLERTGTLRVANPQYVIKDIPTDNTVGTWAFDDELITRLQNVSTVAITGQQIASYNV